MWNRKKFKEDGRKHLKRNYWPCVMVCFLLAFLGCENSSSVTVIHGYDTNVSVPENVIQTTDRLTNMRIFDSNDNFLTVAIEGVTGTISYVFKFVGSVKDLILNNFEDSLILALVCAIEFVYVFLICNPIIVGSRKFFITNVSDDKTKVGTILDPFRNKGYYGVVKTLFLQTLYLFLWLFTIVGFFIKIYEYRMIPFILADNPNITSKEAFLLSKKLMNGNKWEMFKFDMSYIGWYLLSFVTFGLSAILYSNPYKDATTAQIYLKLKENAN